MNTNNKFYYCHFVMVNEEYLPLEWSSGQPCIIMINYPGYRLFWYKTFQYKLIHNMKILIFTKTFHILGLKNKEYSPKMFSWSRTYYTCHTCGDRNFWAISMLEYTILEGTIQSDFLASNRNGSPCKQILMIVLWGFALHLSIYSHQIAVLFPLLLTRSVS